MDVHFIDSKGVKRSFTAEEGQTLMEVAAKNRIDEILANCGGALSCATCHVYVDEAWIDVVGKPEMMEEDMLDMAFDVRPNSRLSCQIILDTKHDGLTVVTPKEQG